MKLFKQILRNYGAGLQTALIWFRKESSEGMLKAVEN
jgi:hypothetical protein